MPPYAMPFDLKNRLKQIREAKSEMPRGVIVSEGREREYYVYVPASCQAQKNIPLILCFHGGGGLAYLMPLLSGLNALADREGFIVVYPQAFKKHWNDGRTPEVLDVDDAAFITAVLQVLTKKYSIDEHRIYAAGISNGGFFSQYLAITMPGRLAAIASVAATIAKPVLEDMIVPIPTPIIFILGMSDPVVPFNGGSIYFGMLNRGPAGSAADALDYWAKANGCSAPPAVSSRTGADGEKIYRKEYTNAANTNTVLEIAISDGGHGWPSGTQYLPVRMIGKTSHDVDANGEIWSFFKQHSLR